MLKSRGTSIFLVAIVIILSCYTVYQKVFSGVGLPQRTLVVLEQELTPVKQDLQNKHSKYMVTASDKAALFDKFNPLPQHVVRNVERFVFFVGYPRSGHSIISSVMDANPNIVVAQEFKVFRKAFMYNCTELLKNKTHLLNEIYGKSWNDSHHGITNVGNAQAGHHYGVGIISNFSWHGMYKNLKVVADKGAGSVTEIYAHEQKQLIQAYKQLSNTLQIPVQAIHVVRNPYDMIASNSFFRMMYQGHPPTERNKFNNTAILQRIKARIFGLAESVMNMKKDAELNWKVLDIHNADFVKEPVKTVKRICAFLKVDCPEGYLQACKQKAYSSSSKTRRLVAWPKKMLAEIAESMKKFPFFHRYSYYSE